jgi:hypothetical protein
MTEPQSLVWLLNFLGRLMDDKSKLSTTKFNAAVAKAARLEARGWKYLAGRSAENIDDLMRELYDAPTIFLRNRNVPDGDGRPEGSKDKKYAGTRENILTRRANHRHHSIIAQL